MQRSRCVDDFPASEHVWRNYNASASRPLEKMPLAKIMGPRDLLTAGTGRVGGQYQLKNKGGFFSKAAREPHGFRACDLIG